MYEMEKVKLLNGGIAECVGCGEIMLEDERHFKGKCKPNSDLCCFCKNASKYVVRGGRFGEAGNWFACSMCLNELIDWVFTHPRLKVEGHVPMVEVRAK